MKTPEYTITIRYEENFSDCVCEIEGQAFCYIRKGNAILHQHVGKSCAHEATRRQLLGRKKEGILSISS